MAAEVLSELEFLGALAIVDSNQITATVDGSQSSISIHDGASVEVPEGAFSDTIEVTVTVVAIDFASVVESPPWARIYAVSTDDVDPAEPVVLNIPRPAAELNATQLVDGRWQRVEIPDGPTARIPIHEFSTSLTAVMEARIEAKLPQAESASLSHADQLATIVGVATEAAEQPKDYLSACIRTLYVTAWDDRDNQEARSKNELAAEMIAAYCVRSLIDHYNPTDARVETVCVDEQLSLGLDFQSAVDECADQPTTTQSPTTRAPVTGTVTTSTTISTTTTLIEPALTFPRTYAGTGTYTISWSFSPDSCTQDGQELEVTLHPDGSATGFIHFLSPATVGFTRFPDGSFTGGGCAGYSTDSDVELTGSHTPPPPGSDEFGSVVLDFDGRRWLEGTYDADVINIDYRGVDRVMEEFAENTGLSEPRIFGDHDFVLVEVLD